MLWNSLRDDKYWHRHKYYFTTFYVYELPIWAVLMGFKDAIFNFVDLPTFILGKIGKSDIKEMIHKFNVS